MQRGEPLSFLIADDDLDDQFLITESFHAIDPELVIAAVGNGAELLDFLTRQGRYKGRPRRRPDAIILDVNMPLMDGLEALTRIKMLEELSDIPVFIYTTSLNPALKVKCMQTGATQVFVKPYDPAAIQEIVVQILSVFHPVVLTNQIFQKSPFNLLL